MSHTKDAENKEVSRGCEERIPETQREGLGRFSQDCSVDGIEQIRIGDAHSPGEDINWKLTPIRDTTAGKILERINALEARHIKYVDAHQSRLSARLEEAREEKEEFVKESNQIKSDIYHLAIAQQANGNGHIN